MTTITAAGQASLFSSGCAPKVEPKADAARSVLLGLRPAVARLVATTAPDKHDREQRLLLLLVVECPFCGHQHIHPGGHPGAPRLCLRRSRCVGRPAGAYYFPGAQL